MASGAAGAHVKIGSYEFQLDESHPEPYVYEEVTNYTPQGVEGDPSKIDIDAEERLLWRMTDWTGGEGQQYFNPEDPTMYEYSEETTNTYNTQGHGLNARRRGQLTGKPTRYRPSEVTVTDSKKKVFLAVADGQAWMGGSKEIFYNDFDTDGSDAWTSKTSNVPSGHSITAFGGSEDWVFYATGDSNSASLYAANVAVAGDDVVADSTTAFGADGQPLRERLVMYNGRLYGWTGRKLFEFDVFDSVNTVAGTVTALTKNANPGYRKVYDSGTNEMVDGNYGGSSINSWWADMVASETAVYFMVGSRGQTRIYEFKAGIAKPIWFPPTGFTCKSLAVQNGVLYAFGQWGGETDTAHKGGAGWALPLQTRQPVHLAWFRMITKQSLHMQEAAPSYGSQVMVAACNTGRVFIYDADTDGVTMLDKLPWTYATNVTTSNAYPNGAAKIGALLTYGKHRIAAVHYPRAADAVTKYETYVWDGDGEGDRATANSNHSQTCPLIMPWYDFRLPYETKALVGFHVSWRVEDHTTTSGLKAGQTIDISYERDDSAGATSITQITSATTPSSGVRGRHFVAVSTDSSTYKFLMMRYTITLTGARVSATNYAPPILYDVTVEARSLDHDRTWTLQVRLKDDQPQNRVGSMPGFGSQKRTYLRELKSNKNIVAFLDYDRYQTQHGAAPNTYTSHQVMVHRVRDIIKRNGEGYAEVVLKAVHT